MPTYDYKCPTCGKRRDVFLKLADLSSSVYCQYGCGQPMLRQVSAPHVVGDYAPYECPVTGKMIEGRRAHEENLKRTGCRILEPGESAAHKRHLERENENFDKMIEATADELITTLPPEKKEKLAAEMESGMTTEYSRGTTTGLTHNNHVIHP